jgi:hypothetical protein
VFNVCEISVVVVLLASSVILEILDPPVSETKTSGFAEHGSAEHTVTLYISRKSDCSI